MMVVRLAAGGEPCPKDATRPTNDACLAARYKRFASRHALSPAIIALERSFPTPAWQFCTDLDPFEELDANYAPPPGTAIGTAVIQLRAAGPTETFRTANQAVAT